MALVERIRPLRRDGRDVEPFLADVHATRLRIEPVRAGEALAVGRLGDEAWARHARDAMIAAHVREGDVLWTTDPRDLLAVGLEPSQVRGV